MSLAKGQLAASVIILVSSFVFVGVYIYVYIRALRDNENMANSGIRSDFQLPPTTTYVAASSKYQTPQPILYQAEAIKSDGNRMNVHDQTGLVSCHNCGATLKISERI